MKALIASIVTCSTLLTTHINAQERSNLNELIKDNRYPVTLEQEKITGSGANKLLHEANQANVFMLGENHAMKEIADISRVLYEELSKGAPRVLVTEIGAATATETEILVRDGQFEAFLSEGTNLMSVPFFFLDAEAPLLTQVTDKFPSTSPAIWGLDQEFLAGTPAIIRGLAREAKTETELEAVDSLRWKNFFNPFLIGESDGSAFVELAEAFANSSEQAKATIQLMSESNEIYKANSDGRGRWSNETRETLMMTNFENYAAKHEGELPNMFFKFGAYHLHKGRSPTVKQALGIRVHNWAQQRGWTSLNVFIDSVNGETIHPLLGTKTESQTNASWRKSVFNDLMLDDQATLFDLRPLKGHPEVESMSKRMQYMVNGYDYLLLFKQTEGQQYLPGTLITIGYGVPILVVGLVIIIGVIFFIVRFAIRKWRKRAVA